MDSISRPNDLNIQISLKEGIFNELFLESTHCAKRKFVKYDETNVDLWSNLTFVVRIQVHANKPFVFDAESFAAHCPAKTN